MTDTIIPRSEAIARMAKGEKCETCFATEWFATRWKHFDPPYSHAKFRIPPEPRRDARSFWIEPNVAGSIYLSPVADTIHVREVLPDEVTLRKMTENGVRDFVFDKNVVAARCSTGADKCVAFARALGLIREEDKP